MKRSMGMIAAAALIWGSVLSGVCSSAAAGPIVGTAAVGEPGQQAGLAVEQQAEQGVVQTAVEQAERSAKLIAVEQAGRSAKPIAVEQAEQVELQKTEPGVVQGTQELTQVEPQAQSPEAARQPDQADGHAHHMEAQPAVSGKPYHFGFNKSRNGQLPSIAREGFMELLKQHDAIFLGNTAEKELYLTFDNGYENGFTARVLDVLKEKQVPAAFFITGHYLKDQPELVKRMVNEGHIVGNHSWSHPDLSQTPDQKIAEELDRVKQGVAELTGQKEMAYLRPPRGIFSGRMLAAAKQLGYTSVFWSVAYKDWETNNQKGAQYAYDKVMEQLHPGAVMLLHSVSRDNAEALGRIIDDARKMGYTFKSLDQLTAKEYR